MHLVNRNQSVPGGFWYKIPETGQKVSTDGNFSKLVGSVIGYYEMRDIAIPEDLRGLIQEQICERVPEKYCRYGKGLGDRLAKAIHGVAGMVDAVLGTELKKKARGCGGCGSRRRRLNGSTF